MWRRLIDINLTGSFMVSQAVGRALMAENKPGSIILVASMSGSIVNYPQEQSCYNASKAGVIQLGKSLAAEWAKYGIRVNCISPGNYPSSNLKSLSNMKSRLHGHSPEQRPSPRRPEEDLEVAHPAKAPWCSRRPQRSCCSPRFRRLRLHDRL